MTQGGEAPQPQGVRIAATTQGAHTQSTLPYLVLAFGVLATGMSGILVKWANAPGTINGFYRMAIAIAVLAVPITLQAKRHNPYSRRHVWLAALGGVFFALDLALWNNAVLITTAANATLFGNTSVIWVTLGAMLLFKERLRSAFWSGLIVALLGMLIILGQDFFVHPTLGIGDLMSVLAGFFYGMFFLAAERSRDRLNAFVAWWVSSLSSAISLFLISVVLGLPFFGYPLETYLSIIALALVTQVGGYLSVNYALGHLPSSIVSPTLLGQPVVTAILAVPLLGQPLTPIQILGGLLVLGGILIVHRTKH